MNPFCVLPAPTLPPASSGTAAVPSFAIRPVAAFVSRSMTR
jgi:hypothetical protein